MKKLFSIHAILSILLGAVSLSALAQNPPATQVPQTNDDKQEAIRVSSNLVNVNVIVTDRYGRLATGLTQQDFSLREDGSVQKISNFSAQEAPFSVVLLIDTSRSTVRKLGAIQKAAENFIKQLQPRDRVMVLTFDDRITPISDFTGDASTLKKAVKAARTGYSTRLYDAINYAITEKLNPLQGRRAIVVLTDGVDTASKQATFDSTVDLVASSNIISYAIQYETRNEGTNPLRPFSLPGGNSNGSALLPNAWPTNTWFNKWQLTYLSFAPTMLAWGQEIEWQQGQNPPASNQPYINIPRTTIIGGTERDGQPAQQRPNSMPLRDRYIVAGEYLRTIATISGARHLRADSIENTSYAFQLIAEELRNLYTLDYYSSNEQKDGQFHQIAVTLSTRELTPRTRPGYRVAKEEAPEQPKAVQPKP